MTETNTPKVYTSIHKVLKTLQVDKNGVLPGNLGGKNYATAESISNEVKKLFVANDLIPEYNEEIVTESVADLGDKKMRFQTTIKGTFKAIHIEDGSSITFSGHGHGLATGTAMAANIASTFAMKNALQRQFLISEDSVERNGQAEQAPPKQNSAQQEAAKATTPPPAPKKLTGANGDAQKRVVAKMEDGTYDRERVTALNAKIAKQLGKSKGDVMVELEKALEAGEVA